MHAHVHASPCCGRAAIARVRMHRQLFGTCGGTFISAVAPPLQLRTGQHRFGPCTAAPPQTPLFVHRTLFIAAGLRDNYKHTVAAAAMQAMGL